ncbi:MAG: ankyrin repeat domain-containing protein [Brumimicrobium sp.]|nr:ankyrin repeat domain-containing protein [Brumimicrobium sp.]
MVRFDPDDISTYPDWAMPSSPAEALALIEAGEDPNKKDSVLENTPLIKACIDVNEFSMKVVEILVDNGADINLCNKYGVSPLHELVSHHSPGHPGLKEQLAQAELLLKKGANPNTFSEIYQNTPLHYAVFMNAKEMVSLLLKYGADQTVENAKGQTPKKLAMQEGFDQITNMLG